MTGPVTPIYGWPYHALTDPPDGADLGEDLALAIEATVSGFDTRVDSADARLSALEARTTLLETRVGCQLRRVANQSANTGVETTIIWDTEDEDTSSMWAAGTTVTIPEDGIWAVTFRAVVASIAGSGYAFILFSSTVLGGHTQWLGTDTLGRFDRAPTLRLAAGDTYTCAISHGSGSARNVTAFTSAYKVSD